MGVGVRVNVGVMVGVRVGRGVIDGPISDGALRVFSIFVDVQPIRKQSTNKRILFFIVITPLIESIIQPSNYEADGNSL